MNSFGHFEPAIRACLAAHVPFSAVAPMDSTEPRWFCDPGNSKTRTSDCFIAVPWNTCFKDRYVVRDVLSVEQAKSICADGCGTPFRLCTSTDRAVYLKNLNRLINDLNNTGGKTVISRIIAGENKDVVSAALAYLDSAPGDTYRCIFYTPMSGCWILATPETLCNVDICEGRLQTVALAGTRPAGTGGDWDEKNIDEQNMVRRYIVDKLTACGCTDIQCITDTRIAASVEHIQTKISANMARNANYPDIIDALNPTPAVCGFPLSVSLKRIADIEDHHREMYGGYTGICTETGITTAVTLRCARIEHEHWCVFAGGGITGRSDAESEWQETEYKAAPLIKSLTMNEVTHK